MKSFPFNRTSHYVTIIIVFLYRRVLITKNEPRCMFPRRNWDPPLSHKRVCPLPTGSKRGRQSRHTHLRWEGGGVPIPTTRDKSLALCLFCGTDVLYSLVETFFCFYYSWALSRAHGTPAEQGLQCTKEVVAGTCRIFEKLWLEMTNNFALKNPVNH
jgi:hypothetical protein